MITARTRDYSTPQECGVAEIEYPFEEYGDSTTFVVTRTYKQIPANFKADKNAGLYAPGSRFDRDYPTAVLVSTSKPVATETGLYIFQRRFAVIPIDRSTVSFMRIVKPAMPSGTYPQNLNTALRLYQPDATQSLYDAYERRAVTTDSGAPSAFRPTGGTSTATFAGSTTAAQGYTAAPSTWQTALNGLTPVSNRGNVVVTGSALSAGDLVVTFNAYATAVVSGSGLVVPSGWIAQSVINAFNGGYFQSIWFGLMPNFNAPPTQTNTLTCNTYAGFTPTPGFTPSELSGAGYKQLTWDFSVGGGYYFTGGSYTLTALGQTTASLAYNASASTIAAAVTSTFTNLAAYGPVSVSVQSQIIGGLIYRITIVVLVSASFTTGTYSITIGGTLSTFNYSDSQATISAALNALGTVVNRGGVAVAKIPSNDVAFTINLNYSNPLISIDATSLTPSGCVPTVTSTDGAGRVQVISVAAPFVTRQFLCAAGHNIVATDTIMIRTNSVDYIGISGKFSVVDPYTLILSVAASDAYAAAATITELGRRTKQNYSPGGSVDARVKLVTSSYHPGISPGVATESDIPRPTYEGDSDTLLRAILAGNISINVDVGRLEHWEGLIRQITVTKANAVDL